ncbi:hypothetical protein M9Q43_06700 [Flavobacterium sp. HXWNR29]|jgi:hypothetical protein|uniref:hypothetical protein n=1 Tax=Flavobacterium odoriferum TaxID=2946604 RepID=UPI0021CB438D|nr:hypothetical protein [Flavobacterium sp. HXWNR29]MCU4188853.1 hypothetical protein [Flavobacterium sp. HXWNR29]
MKKLVIILIIVMFLKPIFPVLDYIINYDYIANELCENKAKPELKCNGKCHLVNELAKASEDDKPINSDKKNNSKQEIEVLFFQEIKTFVVEQIYFHNRTSIGDNYANFYFHKACCSVFHPPIFSA